MKSQSLIPLNSGAYSARSKLSDYLICENLFPEINPEETDPTVAVSHYPIDGKSLLSSCPAPGIGRGVFALSTGALYACVASTLYYIDPNWQWHAVGNVNNLATPISMTDNGVTAMIVDGSNVGWMLTLQDRVFAFIQDATGSFEGSRRVDFADTFIAFSKPGTNSWGVTLSNQIAFNALVTANKDSTPDNIETLAFNLRQAWLLGEKNSEVWYLSGGIPFPYSEWPNILIPYGIAAPYSLIQADILLFWLSKNAQGSTIAVKINNYAVEAISTRALEYEWSLYPTVADCVGSTYQMAGHTFIMFHFPTADKTWVYDLATKQWHQRISIDANGLPHRDRAAFYASVSPDGGYVQTVVGQDWQTGAIYQISPANHTDNNAPIVCRRTFPHVMQDMKFMTHQTFVADFETGGLVGMEEPQAGRPWSSGWSSAWGPLVETWNAGGPALCMRYSNNGGASFGNYRQKNLVTSGHYRSMMRFRGLGMARDRVYEVMWAFPGPSALLGAYAEAIKHGA